MFGQHGQSILSYDGVTTRMWDAASGRGIASLGGNPKDSALQPAFLHDGESVITGWPDGTIRVRNVCTGNEVMVLRGHADGVTRLCATPDSRIIVSGSLDRTIRVWDAETRRQLAVLHTSEQSIAYVNVSADGRFVAIVGGNILYSTGGGDTVEVLDIESGRRLVTLRGHRKQVREVCFSPDGEQIATVAFDGTVGIWNLRDGQRMFSLEGHWDTVTSVIYSPDGRRVASGSYDKTVRVWDATNGKEIVTLCGHEAPIYCVRFYCVRFSPDGTQIVSGSGDRTVRIWSSEGGRQLKRLRGPEASINCLSISPDGHLVASASGDIQHQHLLDAHDNKVGVWDVESGRLLSEMAGHEHIAICGRFSPNSKLIVSGSCDGTVRLWDAKTMRYVAALRPNGGIVWGVSFSPDGQRIAVGLNDRSKSVQVWDTKSLKCIEDIEGTCDADAIAAGPVSFPYRLRAGELETVVEDVVTGRKIAWLPVALEQMTTHPSGHLWAGASANYLALFRLDFTAARPVQALSQPPISSRPAAKSSRRPPS